VHADAVDGRFAELLSILRGAEAQLGLVYPALAEAAADTALRDEFARLQERTRVHLARLANVVYSGRRAGPRPQCPAILELVAEAHGVVGNRPPGEARDRALAALARRMARHQAAVYGSARVLARRLRDGNAEALLGATLEDELRAVALLAGHAAEQSRRQPGEAGTASAVRDPYSSGRLAAISGNSSSQSRRWSRSRSATSTEARSRGASTSTRP
jgi:ferritin-like metal-binding protein YciE